MYLPLRSIFTLPAFAGARQKPQQDTASGEPHQGENAPPESPRIGVDAGERQACIQIVQGVMGDDAAGRGAPGFAARDEGGQRFLVTPLDAKVADLAQPEGVQGIALRAAHINRRFMRRRSDKVPGASAAILGYERAGKIASHLRRHSRILREWMSR